MNYLLQVASIILIDDQICRDNYLTGKFDLLRNRRHCITFSSSTTMHMLLNFTGSMYKFKPVKLTIVG